MPEYKIDPATGKMVPIPTTIPPLQTDLRNMMDEAGVMPKKKQVTGMPAGGPDSNEGQPNTYDKTSSFGVDFPKSIDDRWRGPITPVTPDLTPEQQNQLDLVRARRDAAINNAILEGKLGKDTPRQLTEEDMKEIAQIKSYGAAHGWTPEQIALSVSQVEKYGVSRPVALGAESGAEGVTPGSSGLTGTSALTPAGPGSWDPKIEQWRTVPPQNRPIGVYPDAYVQAVPPLMPGMPDPSAQKFAPDGKPIVWITNPTNPAAGGVPNPAPAPIPPTGVLPPSNNETSVFGGVGGQGTGGPSPNTGTVTQPSGTSTPPVPINTESGSSGSEYGSQGGTDPSGTVVTPPSGTTITPPDGTVVPPPTVTQTATDWMTKFQAGQINVQDFIKGLGATFGDGTKPIGINGQPGGSISPQDITRLFGVAGKTPQFQNIHNYLQQTGGKLPIRRISISGEPQLVGDEYKSVTTEQWVYIDPFTGKPIMDSEEYLDASGAAAEWEMEQKLRESYLDLQASLIQGQAGAQFQAQLAILQDQLKSAADLEAFKRESEFAKTEREAGQDFASKEREARQDFESMDREDRQKFEDEQAKRQHDWDEGILRTKNQHEINVISIQQQFEAAQNAMNRAIQEGNLALAREQFTLTKQLETERLKLDQQRSMLDAIGLIGQYPHIRNMIASTGMFDGLSVGGLNIGSLFGQTGGIPTNAMPSLTELTQMSAGQREAVINELAAQYGIPKEQILEQIKRNAPGSTRRLS